MLLIFLLVFPAAVLTPIVAAMMARYKGRHRFLLWLVPVLTCIAALGIGFTIDALLLGEMFSGTGTGFVGPT